MCWKPFVVKTDNKSLASILTTPNLDATWHHWVESLARFAFSIRYQKGRNNVVVDVLSHVTSKLNAEAVKSILGGVTVGTTGRPDDHDPMVAETDERIHNQVKETAVQAQATHMYINLHAMDRVAAQQEDPILKIVMECISYHKVQDLKHLLGDHTAMEQGMAILSERKKFILHQGAFYHCHTPARELEEALRFLVPMAHRVAALNGCHRDAGHKDLWQMVSLLQDQLWWPSLAFQMQKVISSCERCIQHEGAQVMAPLQAILITSPL